MPSSHPCLRLLLLAVLALPQCLAHTQHSPALNLSAIQHTVRQLQLLSLEKEGLDAWSAALTEHHAQERALRTGSRHLQAIDTSSYVTADGAWVLTKDDKDWVSDPFCCS